MRAGKRSVYVVLMVLLSITSFGQSKIVDDSTRQVYGAYTTLYQTFEGILNNYDEKIQIDTTVGNLHPFAPVERLNYKYQDLGNLGTALRPVFYNLPEQVGIRSGFDAYVPYYINPEDIQYFDTKSPYTLLDVVVGGTGRAVTNIRHTRNISPYWNAGFHYYKINADKQAASSGRGDNQVTSLTYNLHMDYQSPNGKYHGLTSFTRLNHKVREQGGQTIPAGAPINEYFDDNVAVNLQNAQSQDFRFAYHLYNQYNFRKEFQLYQSLQYIQNRNFFTVKPFGSDVNFFDQVLINRDSTTDQFQTNQFINEFGIKGDYTKMFYRFFVKFRNVDFRSRYLPAETNFFENSGGFELRYDFDSRQNIRGSGEYILGGFYKFGGSYFNNFFTLEYWRTQSRPSIIENSYFGNHFEWQNNFATPSSDLLKGSLIYNSKIIRLEPFVSITNVMNNIYWDYDQKPAQAEGSAQVLGFGLNLNLILGGKIHWENEAVYTQVTGGEVAANAIRIPDIFLNSRLYYGSYWFGEKIYMMFGVDGNYKSDYFAPAYNPVLQQFYLQDDFNIPAYFVADAFLEFQIDYFTMFLKLEHANQGAVSGYFTHPYYRGQPRVFDIGIRWVFFN